jgi:quercetin dioxygenase-like cupin family protein
MPPTVLLRSEESAGAVSVIEVASGPGFTGPHLHRHDFDEALYVIEGELTFQLRDEVFTRGAGELAFAPRGVAHTYANHSDAPARALIICTPAGFERYFARIAADRDGIEPPDWALHDIPAVERLGPQVEQQEPSG